MGEFKEIEISKIRPTQDYLFSKKVKKSSNSAAPVPVFKDVGSENSYGLLDRHHSLSAAYLAGNEVQLCWVADHPNDKMPPIEGVDSNLVSHINNEIKKRFDYAMFYTPQVQGRDVDSIEN